MTGTLFALGVGFWLIVFLGMWLWSEIGWLGVSLLIGAILGLFIVCGRGED